MQAKTDRNKEIFECYLTNRKATLTDIGKKYGVSRQRVHQIIVEYAEKSGGYRIK